MKRPRIARYPATIFVLACCFLCSAIPLPTRAEVIPYGSPLISPVSQAFSVKVNGQPVFAHSFMSYDYVHFAFSGTANVEVTFKDNITKGVVVTPSKFNVIPAISGKTFTFTLTEPRKLFIRTNVADSHSYWGRGNDHHFLVLFADPLETNPPALGQANVVSVLDKGADVTGEKDSAAAINRAIKACPKSGTVYVPAGKYRLDSTVQLDTPDMTFYLAADAFLQKPHGENAVLLMADGVTVKGRGTIEADSYAMRSESPQDRPLRNFVLEDVVLRDSHISVGGDFHMMARFTLDNFQIRNVKALGCPQNETYGKQRDGFALDDTTNGVVDNIFSWSGDDAFYVWSRHAKSENILVKNCEFRSEGGASSMKDMSQIAINNLQYIDCVSLRGKLEIDCRQPKGAPRDAPWGSQDRILFKNIDIEELADIGLGAYFSTAMMHSSVNAVFENVNFRGFWPKRNQFIVRAGDGVNVRFKGLKVKDRLIASREELTPAGFKVVWEGDAKIDFQ